MNTPLVVFTVSAITKTNAGCSLTSELEELVGEVTYAVKQSNFVVYFCARVPARNPELHSASKSDTDHVRLWQTCHFTYFKSMYHHKGLGNRL